MSEGRGLCTSQEQKLVQPAPMRLNIVNMWFPSVLQFCSELCLHFPLSLFQK